MLEEAVEVIRTLWQGRSCSHRGRHYRVENARIYDLPEHSPPVLISGFGPKATELAARIGDGYCTVTPVKQKPSRPLPRESRRSDKLVAGGVKVCWARGRTARRPPRTGYGPTSRLPGELAQILPTPGTLRAGIRTRHRGRSRRSVPCGPDLDLHLKAIKRYEDAGFDELYVQQIGADHERFFETYANEILPHYNDGESASELTSAAV